MTENLMVDAREEFRVDKGIQMSFVPVEKPKKKKRKKKNV